MYLSSTSVYTRFVSKRLVEIDDDLLDQARRAAGTPTIKATVEAGLRRLVETDLTQRHVRRLRRHGALDLGRVEAARAPRLADRG
jgi:Arc/MetJ family transcription regulator